MLTSDREYSQKVFISYRNDTGQPNALNVYHGFKDVLGDASVFIDVKKDAIETGRSWSKAVKKAIESCDTLLLIYDPSMGNYLNESSNAVVYEIELAIKLGLRIVIIRIDGAEYPKPENLPTSIRGITDLSSKLTLQGTSGTPTEIGSDNALDDVARIAETLTGIVPANENIIDRSDIVILLILSSIAALLWSTWARHIFNNRENWLWGGAILILWFCWLALSRLIVIYKSISTQTRRLNASIWSCVLILSMIPWAVIYNGVYSLPIFSKSNGILLSRLKGDPKDNALQIIANSFKSKKSANSKIQPIEVRILPRRVGFSSNSTFLNRVDDGNAESTYYGEKAHAGVVLWGTKNTGSQNELKKILINISFIQSDAIFTGESSRVNATLDTRSINGVEGDIELISRVLPEFLNAHRTYFDANKIVGENISRIEKLKSAQARFIKILSSLTTYDIDDEINSSGLKNIKASTHFFLGKIHSDLGELPDAEREYVNAVELTSTTGNNQSVSNYIEAINNLGWILERTMRSLDALHALSKVKINCSDDYLLQCSYVDYNIGTNYLILGDLKNAFKAFERVAYYLESRKISGNDKLLLLSTYQNLAYTMVLLSTEETDTEVKQKRTNLAESMWHKANHEYKIHGISRPDYHDITLARIHIERGNYADAIKILEILSVQGVNNDHRHRLLGLLAGLYHCNKKIDKSVHHISLLISEFKGSKKRIDEGIQESQLVVDNCRV